MRAAFGSIFKRAYADDNKKRRVWMQRTTSHTSAGLWSFFLPCNIVENTPKVLSDSAASDYSMIDPQAHLEDILSEYSQALRSFVVSSVVSRVGHYGASLETEDHHQEQKQQQRSKFPTLQAQLLHSDNTKSEFWINSNDPIPVENEVFVGHVLLLVRPLCPQHDPDYEHRIRSMQEPETTFVFQLQGKFKQPVRKSRVFVGAEIARLPKMGSITEQLCHLVLGFLSSKQGGMKYSFGTEKETPHISFPLHTGMNHIHVTNSNDVAPPMGAPFAESDTSRLQRRDTSEDEYWSTDQTYSMSYSAASVDLSSWRALLPFELPLETFWGPSDLQLVIYNQEEDESSASQPQQNKTYLFNLQLGKKAYDISNQ